MRFWFRGTIGVYGVVATCVITCSGKNYLPDRDTPVPADQPIPTVDFVRPRIFESPVLNPSGTAFAAFTKNERVENNLLICELGTGKVRWSKSGVRFFSWIDDTHLWLNHLDNGVVDIEHPRRQAMVSDVLSLGRRGLMHDTGFLWTWPFSDWPMPWSSGQVQHVWNRLDDGNLAYCQTIQQDGRRHLYRNEGRTWVDCHVDLDEITPVWLGAGPHEMIVIGPAAKGRPRALQRFDTTTGQLGEIIYRDPEYDCRPFLFYKRDTMETIGVSVPAKIPRIVWFDGRMKEVQGMIDRQFPGAIAEVVNADIRQNRFVIETESDREPPVFLLLDYEKKSLGLIKKVSPWLDPARMAPMQVLEYKARDGSIIEGYLTLPRGASKEHPAPVVVSVHGGPWNSRSTWGMNRTAQFFASRGYATFEPNYRGSAGYDSRFEPADRFDFQKMSNDVVDGVHALCRTGVVDPHRMAVLGFGFGAYLAVCGVVDEPDLYRCAIVFGGIYDWDRQFRKKDSRTMFEDEWLQRRLREFNITPPAPLQHKERIKIPFFFTRNVDTSDITRDSEVFDFYLATKKQVACEFFGDLNIASYNEAYSEVVERFDRFDAFLAKYCSSD